MDELEVYNGCLIVKDPGNEQYYIYQIPNEQPCGQAPSKEMAKQIINCMN